MIPEIKIINLSNEEKKVIEAMRKGGEINIWFHNCETSDEAIEKVNILNEVKEIDDFDEFVSFSSDHNELEINAFVKK